MLGLIKRTFKHMDSDMQLCLSKSLVRPHLEYCSTVWAVLLKKKKEASEIEKVQRSATKMVKNIRDLSYSERLRKLGLPTLEYKRRRADMIETFKIIHGIDKVDKNDMNIKSSKKNCRTKYSHRELWKHGIVCPRILSQSEV